MATKLNKFSGIGGEMLVESRKCDRGGRGIDGRVESKRQTYTTEINYKAG